MRALRSAVMAMVTAAIGFGAEGEAAAQRLGDFVPVGVRYQLHPDPVRQRQDLEELKRLRFNVVALSDQGDGPEIEVGIIDRLLGGAADARVRMTGLATLSEKDTTSASSVRLAAWYSFGIGARGIIFGGWAALQRDTDRLTAAVEFADHVSRNAALYAPLRPRVAKDDPGDVRVDGNDLRISARMLESSDALLLVVTNHGSIEAREVTLTFSPDMPEAVWQNMLTGAAVNFVAGPKGPVYTRTFPPEDVLVLMIRKLLK